MRKTGEKLRIAVNSSMNSFSNSEYHDFLASTEERCGFGYGDIVLEVAETQTIDIPLDCLEALISLLLKKCSLFIDNFDIGRSHSGQVTLATSSWSWQYFLSDSFDDSPPLC